MKVKVEKFLKFASMFPKYLSFQGNFRLFPFGTEESMANPEDVECMECHGEV